MSFTYPPEMLPSSEDGEVFIKCPHCGYASSIEATGGGSDVSGEQTALPCAEKPVAQSTLQRIASEIAPELDAALKAYLYGTAPGGEEYHALVSVLWDNKVGILRVLQNAADRELKAISDPMPDDNDCPRCEGMGDDPVDTKIGGNCRLSGGNGRKPLADSIEPHTLAAHGNEPCASGVVAQETMQEKLMKALQRILDDPYEADCPMCDRGVIRNKAKQHWDDCGWQAARRILNEAIDDLAYADLRAAGGIFADEIEPQVSVAHANEPCGPEEVKPPSPSETK